MDTSKLDVPAHVAVIMDGNARWAKSKSLPLAIGHRNGSKAVKTLVKSALEFGIKYLTIYAFSTENWQRPKKEVDYLMGLFQKSLDKETDDLNKNGVRIVISGNLSAVSEEIKNKIKKIEKITRNNNSLILNIAFDYGAKREIVDAVKQIILDIENNKTIFADIDEDLIRNNLYNSWIPDPELLIRTSGDMRLSNFLLWQISYTELYFTKKLWPDFNKEDLYKAILDFNKRERRYGKR
jgi:undecaprenyl diphosphate synthase